MRTTGLLLLFLALLACNQKPARPSLELQVMDETVVLFQREDLKVSLSNGQLLIEDDYSRLESSIGAIPFKRVVLSSTTQLRYFQALGQLNRVVACPWLNFVRDKEIKQRLVSGDLVDVTQGAGLDLEKIVALEPDLMLYDPRAMDFVPRLQAMGVTCIPFFEYQEKDPLNRVDWLQLVGMICDEYEMAVQMSAQIAIAYGQAKAEVRDNAPAVLFGSYYQGTWSAPGGGSLIAQMIRDAGGRYAIQDQTTASVDLDPEEFIRLLVEVDFIGMIQQGPMTRASWSALDSRFDAEQLVGKEIFYCNTLHSDYFGKGVLEPQVMLKELESILSDSSLESGYFRLAE